MWWIMITKGEKHFFQFPSTCVCVCMYVCMHAYKCVCVCVCRYHWCSCAKLFPPLKKMRLKVRNTDRYPRDLTAGMFTNAMLLFILLAGLDITNLIFPAHRQAEKGMGIGSLLFWPVPGERPSKQDSPFVFPDFSKFKKINQSLDCVLNLNFIQLC